MCMIDLLIDIDKYIYACTAVHGCPCMHTHPHTLMIYTHVTNTGTFTGSCLFEGRTCGWRDHSSGLFTWILAAANNSATTHGPTTDGDFAQGGEWGPLSLIMDGVTGWLNW